MISICYEACKECNLKCDYCISSDNQEKEGCEISYEDIINKMLRFQPQRIVISGGEPLLDHSIIQKIRMIKEHDKKIYISLSTNGTVKFDFKVLKGYINCIDISLPAIDGNIYEQMRGKNFAERVQKNIVCAKNAGLYVRISYVLTKVNSNELFKVLEFAKSAKVDEVRIGRFLSLRNAQKCKQKYEISQEEIEKLMLKVYEQKYDFDIIPPIDSTEKIEKNYLNIDFNGEFFLPTINGKKYLSEEEIGTKIDKNQYEVFKKVKLTDRFENFFRPLRIRSSESRSLVDEFYSDRTRIIYYPGFRRMQQKAQVFSLEKNPSVRSRLTHSVEVSDVGKRLALRIGDELIHREILDDKYRDSLIAIVENACLLHDLGNPPFGHFGETAIKKWWKDNYQEYIDAYNKRSSILSEKNISFSTVEEKAFLKDFEEFDGNPQGLRNILRICKNLDQTERNMQSGLNLSYPTILCNVKYVRCAGQDKRQSISSDITKKAGYFRSEKNIFDRIYSEMGMYPENVRYPFVYIMEAADDIAYGLSDIADGIEKKIMTLDFFVEKFIELWGKEQYDDIEEVIPEEVYKLIKNPRREMLKDFNNLLGSRWKGIMINDAVTEYVENIDHYLKGDVAPILDNINDCLSKKILKIIKKISREYIYRAPEAEEIEVAGYSIISGLLMFFGQLLKLPYKEFEYFIDDNENPAGKGLDLEWRIFNRLSHTCVESYKQQLVELKEYFRNISFENLEWWLRVHLIIDHISGMTDDYALKTFQICQGINTNF